jgi:carbon monoxide dehydrogenase subunit G
MKLEQSFEVAAPLERVWKTLVDVEHVAPCLPGAAVTGRNEDGSYNGTFTVKIGPTTASYTGKLEMENIDEASHTATMQAQGTDKRGQGGAKATILSRLAPTDGDGTRVEVVTDYHITGRLARFGRGGMIEDISERLLKEFASRLQSSLDPELHAAEAPTEAAPPSASPSDAVSRSEPPADAVSPAGAESPPEPQPAATASAGPTPPTPTGPDAPPVAPLPPPAAETPPPSNRPPPSEPMQGLSLIGSVLWGRVKRNPAPAAAAGVVVVLLLVRGRRRRHGH